VGLEFPILSLNPGLRQLAWRVISDLLHDAWFRPLFAFVIIRHGSREIVHVNVTRSPTDAWVAQQLREATPYEQAPRFLIRDHDGKFGRHFAAAADGACIDVVTIPPKSPNRKDYASYCTS
jgi:hypothetical protein